MNAGLPEPRPDPPTSVWNVANIVYALHASAIVIGIAGSATVIGSFVGSLPSIAAVVLNYVKRGEARGHWIDSHYRWQIRTFWYALLWVVVCALLAATVVGIPFALLALAVVSIWLVYRIGRGWLRLRDRQPMYV